MPTLRVRLGLLVLALAVTLLPATVAAQQPGTTETALETAQQQPSSTEQPGAVQQVQVVLDPVEAGAEPPPEPTSARTRLQVVQAVLVGIATVALLGTIIYWSRTRRSHA